MLQGFWALANSVRESFAEVQRWKRVTARLKVQEQAHAEMGCAREKLIERNGELKSKHAQLQEEVQRLQEPLRGAEGCQNAPGQVCTRP